MWGMQFVIPLEFEGLTANSKTFWNTWCSSRHVPFHWSSRIKTRTPPFSCEKKHTTLIFASKGYGIEEGIDMLHVRVRAISPHCTGSHSDLRRRVWIEGVRAHLGSLQLLRHCQQARLHRRWVLRTLVCWLILPFVFCLFFGFSDV